MNRLKHSDDTDEMKNNGTAYGLVVPWQSMEKILNHKSRHPQPSIPPFLVIVLLRDPFFWILSQQKKIAIRDDAKRNRLPGSVSCENVHQRGTKLCPISRY